MSGLVFSRDGGTLVSTSFDRTLRLWDVQRRRALGPPVKGHTGAILDVAFSGDGKTLASAGADTVWIWDPILWSTDWHAFKDRVCARVRRTLTTAEWNEFLPGEPYRDTCGQG